MSTKQLPLYATPPELSELLKQAGLSRPLFVLEKGLFDNEQPVILDGAVSLRQFTAYLVADIGRPVRARKVMQRNGNVKYAIDQLDNPHAIVVSCGGFVENRRLTASHIGTSSDEKNSIELYGRLAGEVRQKFQKIKSYYVSSKACELLDSGFELTPTARSSETYALKR